MVKQFGSVFSIIAGSEQVHDDEVLEVHFLATLFQMINVPPTDSLHLEDHGRMDGFLFRHFAIWEKMTLCNFEQFL